MQKFIFNLVLIALSVAAMAQDNVSNIRVQQLDDHLVIIYDLSERADIEAFVSFDGGATFRGPLRNVLGAVGKDIAPERDKMFMWNILREVGSVDYDNVVIKIEASAISAPVPTVIQPPAITLHSKRRRVYMDEIELPKDEVRRIMENTHALHVYNRGIARNKWGNIFLISGGALMLGGISVGPYTDSNTLENIAFSCASLGMLVLPLGLIIKPLSIRPIKQSVRQYNIETARMRNTNNIEMDFGITGNGMGLVLRF